MSSLNKRRTANRIAQNLNALGSKEAIQIEGLFYTYDDLRKRVCAFSNKIRALSKIDDRIGLQLQNNIDCYAALVAILISGRTFVPINEGFGIPQCLSIIDIAKIKVLIKSEDTLFTKELLEMSSIEVIEKVIEKDEEVDGVSNEIAYLLFTSGSTGVPKGVPISHHNLDSFIQSMSEDPDWELGSEDRFLQPFNLSFDLFVFSVFMPLFLGATFYTVPLNKVSVYSAALLQENNITVSLLVPSTMKVINKISSDLSFSSLRLSFFCGEALYVDDLKNWIISTPNATQINIYGPTEATVAFSKYIWDNNTSEDESKNGIVPIGVPFGNNLMSLLVLDTGEKELLLGGPQVFQEYVGTDKDPFVIQTNIRYYRTGDICEINKNGNYIFLGRNDGQVKVGGYRIELSDLENKLRKTLPQRQLVVVRSSDEDNLISIHAFIAGKPIDNIIELIEMNVPDYMRPASINFLDSIPLNMNGKTDRNKLKSMLKK